MTSDSVRLVVDCRNTLGEMPVWEARSSTLFWIDVFKPGRVFFWEALTGQVDFWQFDQIITGLALHASGDFVLARTSDIVRFNPRTEDIAPLFSMAEAQPGQRFNDGACDALGRLWIGSMPNNIAEDGSSIPTSSATGGIYRVTEAGQARFFAAQFLCPNAICWSPDGTAFYVADSMQGWIYAYRFDLESGLLGERREFCHFKEFGIPDGAVVDNEGFIWNARWGAGVVLRISPDGCIDRIVKVPATNPTACAFGGADLRTLYVTTARTGLCDAGLSWEPLAGGVFALDVDVAGPSKPAFGAQRDIQSARQG